MAWGRQREGPSLIFGQDGGPYAIHSLKTYQRRERLVLSFGYVRARTTASKSTSNAISNEMRGTSTE